MAIGAYMSIAFIGNAIREFQEIGYISTTHLFGIIPRLEINLCNNGQVFIPTLETTIAQILLLSVYLVGCLYILIMQPRRKKLAETSRKSMANLKDGEIYDDMF
jgi:high-affinity iron transporter